MTEPELAPDATVFTAASRSSRGVVHTRRACPAMQRADSIIEHDRRVFPDPNWCALCTGEAGHNGGVGDTLYQQLRQRHAEGD